MVARNVILFEDLVPLMAKWTRQCVEDNAVPVCMIARVNDKQQISISGLPANMVPLKDVEFYLEQALEKVREMRAKEVL